MLPASQYLFISLVNFLKVFPWSQYSVSAPGFCAPRTTTEMPPVPDQGGIVPLLQLAKTDLLRTSPSPVFRKSFYHAQKCNAPNTWYWLLRIQSPIPVYQVL